MIAINFLKLLTNTKKGEKKFHQKKDERQNRLAILLHSNVRKRLKMFCFVSEQFIYKFHVDSVPTWAWNVQCVCVNARAIATCVDFFFIRFSSAVLVLSCWLNKFSRVVAWYELGFGRLFEMWRLSLGAKVIDIEGKLEDIFLDNAHKPVTCMRILLITLSTQSPLATSREECF